MANDNIYFPLLPKLKEASSVKPAKSNAWEGEPYDFLNQLVESLAVSGSIDEIESIDSIPDVWARPLLFQMALFDKQGKDKHGRENRQFVKGLHERVRGEWRCLLAMLALKNIKHLSLRATAVKLKEDKGTIGSILTTLAPAYSIDEKTDWLNIYVLYYQEIPIALLTPATLIVSAADYSRTLKGRLAEPWSKDGRILTDPIQMLTVDDLKILYQWLAALSKDLRERIPVEVQQRNSVCLDLLQALDDYKQDIQKVCGDVNINVSFEDAELDINVGVFRLLNFTATAQAATADDSAVKLVLSSARQKNKDVLLISPEMVRKFAEQQGVAASQLLVWPGLSANDINEAMLSQGNNVIGQVQLSGAEHRRPDSFFTDRIAVCTRGNAFPGTVSVAGMDVLAQKESITAILPFKQEILEYYTAEEIAAYTQLEYRNGNIRVSFTFPLSGVKGREAKYKVYREYNANDGEIIYIDSNPSDIAIWPNFSIPGWDKYYLFYCNDADTKQELAPDQVYITPWSYQKAYQKTIPNNGLINHYTAKLEQFPEALCVVYNSSLNNGTRTEQIDSGILLLKKPKVLEKIPGKTWKVGIDFGTSSTMIYYRDGNRAPQPLSLAPSLLRIEDSATSTKKYVYFIPDNNDTGRQNGSFLSIYHLINSNKINTEIEPLSDGNIFLLEANDDVLDVFGKHRQSIEADMKWKDDELGRRKINAYIKQLCLQVVAEASRQGAEKIEWNFSYPVAFSQQQQQSFKAACKRAVLEAIHNTGYAEDNMTIEPWAESKAAAYHFNKFGRSDTNFSEGAICLDIGAGSTDISIISGQPGRIVYHTSLHYAGRHLFWPIMYPSQENMDNFFGHTIDFPVGIDMNDKEAAIAVLDAYMRERSEEYLKRLNDLTGSDKVRSSLQKAQFALAGIFYYLGKLLGELKRKGVYAENNVPDIFVGGNGLRIFSWVTGGSFEPDSPFLNVLKKSITEAAGFGNTKFGIILSKTPKCEVANGMIETRPQNDKEFFNEERQLTSLFGDKLDEYMAGAMLAGNEYSFSGEEKSGNEFISAKDISQGITVESLDEVKQFIDCFNEDKNIWFDGLDISDDQLDTLRKKVNSFYVNEIGREPKQIVVEPVFIVAMKKLMEMLVSE